MKTLTSFFLLLCWAALAGCTDENGTNHGNNTNNANNTNNDAGVDADADADADADTWDPRFDGFVTALQADLAASHAYGVSAAVMENGQVTFAHAFGFKDAAGTQALTRDTLMQIGSTTKQMTAVALLRKVQAGTVSLDDTIGELLPNLDFTLDPAWQTQVTLHHLLSHQGAFVDWLPWAGPADDSELVDTTYNTFDNHYFLMNPPGAFWNYSNPNFVFAGLIDQTYDSRMWSDIMVEDVFSPLGMNRTFLRKTEVEADGDYALSYGLGTDDLQMGVEGDVTMERMPDPGWARPAGLVWTTPSQMMAWAKFLIDGNDAVLSDPYRSMITEPHVDTLYGAGSMHYGYGMFVETGLYSKEGDWYAMTVWEHGGNTLSFSHLFYILPEKNFAVAICSSGNMTDFEASVEAAIRSLVELPEPSVGPQYTFDATALDHHVGTYFDPYNVGQVIITREGDTLLIEAPDITAAGYTVTPELTAISSELFLVHLDGEAYDLAFIPAEEGGPSTYIRNRIFVATRVDGGKTSSGLPTRRPTARDIDNFIHRARHSFVPGPLSRILRRR